MPQVIIIFSFCLCLSSFSNGEALAKYSCNAKYDIEECRTIFDTLVRDKKAKLIYLHMKGIRPSGTEKSINQIKELVWVQNTSLNYLAYPDDFEALSFGILSDSIYELDIYNLRSVLYKGRNMIYDDPITTKVVLNFTYTNIISNGTNGSICHRFFEDQYLRNMWFLEIGPLSEIIWFGYDYKCYSSIIPFTEETRIWKYLDINIFIAALCIFSMAWHPIIFTLIEQENDEQGLKNIKAPKPKTITYDLKICKNERFIYYNEGDIPYGFNRLFLVSFRSKYKIGPHLKILNYFPYFRVFVLAIIGSTLLYFFVERHIHNHLPRDIQGYDTLYPRQKARDFFLFLLMFPIFFIIFSIGFSSRKNCTYVFDLARLFFSEESSILREVSFKMLYKTKGGDMSSSIINRFTSLFCLRFWVLVFEQSLRELHQIKRTKHKIKRFGCYVIFSILYVFSALLNIIFIPTVSFFPYLWYLFCMSCFLFSTFKLLFILFLPSLQKGSKFSTKYPILCLIFKTLRILFLYPLSLLVICMVIYILIFLLYYNVILRIISAFVRSIIYIFLIALPQLNSLNYRLILLFMAVISYIFKHLQTFHLLYQEVLKRMFSNINKNQNQNSDNVNNDHHIKIKQFDYVVANTFPVHIEVFFLLLKYALTGIFFCISLTILLKIDNTSTREAPELIHISSFAFILISPAVLNYILLNPVEKRVATYNKKIKDLMKEWVDNDEDKIDQSIHNRVHDCTAWPQNCSYGCSCCVLFCCGCCVDIDRNWNCYVCTRFKARDDMPSKQIIDRGDDTELQRCYIKFPYDLSMLEELESCPRVNFLYKRWCMKDDVENNCQNNTDKNNELVALTVVDDVSAIDPMLDNTASVQKQDGIHTEV